MSGTPSSTDRLTVLANVGPRVERYFTSIGRRTVGDLAGEDPQDLFDQMCAAAGKPLDPCLLDTVASAVDQADGGEPRPWWTYSAERRAAPEGEAT